MTATDEQRALILDLHTSAIAAGLSARFWDLKSEALVIVMTEEKEDGPASIMELHRRAVTAGLQIRHWDPKRSALVVVLPGFPPGNSIEARQPEITALIP